MEIRKRNEIGVVSEVVGKCRNDAEVEAWLDGYERTQWGGDDTSGSDVVERLRHHGLLLAVGGGRVFEVRGPSNHPFRLGELVRQFATKREIEAWLDGYETKPVKT